MVGSVFHRRVVSVTEFATISSVAADVVAGRSSAVEVLEQHLARIDAREAEVHAFNLVTRNEARATAAAIDARVKKGEVLAQIDGGSME